MFEGAIALQFDGLSTRLLLSLTTISGLILISLGLTIIFGLMNLINMAHGAMVMVGVYTAYWLTQIGQPLWLAVIIAPILVGVFGILLEWLLVSRLYDKPAAVLLSTWGVALVMREVVEFIFGTSPKSVDPPLTGDIVVGGLNYPSYWGFIIGVTAVIVLSVIAIFKYTDAGIIARAVIDDPTMASALGVNTVWMNRLTFGFGSALAGLAGALMAPLYSITTLVGLERLLNAFLVVIVGGVGSILGTIAGGTFLGFLENLMRGILPSQTGIAQVTVLVISLIVIRYRPEGLIPSR